MASSGDQETISEMIFLLNDITGQNIMYGADIIDIYSDLFNQVQSSYLNISQAEDLVLTINELLKDSKYDNSQVIPRVKEIVQETRYSGDSYSEVVLALNDKFVRNNSYYLPTYTVYYIIFLSIMLIGALVALATPDKKKYKKT